MFAKQTNAVSEIGHKLSFEAVLADIIALLPQGRFQNEQAISQGIVLPILRELGGDIFGTTIVWTEYQTGEGSADVEDVAEFPAALGKPIIVETAASKPLAEPTLPAESPQTCRYSRALAYSHR